MLDAQFLTGFALGVFISLFVAIFMHKTKDAYSGVGDPATQYDIEAYESNDVTLFVKSSICTCAKGIHNTAPKSSNDSSTVNDSYCPSIVQIKSENFDINHY